MVRMGSLLRLSSAVAGIALGGCATYVAPPAGADYQAADRLKSIALSPVAVAAFQPADPNAPVNRLSLRGAHFTAAEGTFAKHIETAIATDLREAGLLAPAAATRIDGTVLANAIDILGVAEGTGALAVELVVSRGGQQRLRKTYRAATTFDSAFAGHFAINRGMSAYPVLVRTLLQQVYADPAFVDALKP